MSNIHLLLTTCKDSHFSLIDKTFRGFINRLEIHCVLSLQAAPASGARKGLR